LAVAPAFSSAATVAAGRCLANVPGVLLKNISSNACRAVCGTVFCCAQHVSPSKAITATALAILLIARPRPDPDTYPESPLVTEVRQCEMIAKLSDWGRHPERSRFSGGAKDLPVLNSTLQNDVPARPRLLGTPC